MKRRAHENLNNYRLEDKNKDNKESKKYAYRLSSLYAWVEFTNKRSNQRR